MDNRLKKIARRLSEYSLGRFDKRLTLSQKLDGVDAISNGINMLGDELKAITISRDYFTNIFNSVSDMVFILDVKGMVLDVNTSAGDQLNYEPGYLRGRFISFLHRDNLSFFTGIIKQLKTKPLVIISTMVHTSGGMKIPVRIHVSHFKGELKKRLILLTATDITFQIKADNLILRAIIDTQEKERQRLAKDLHDSLTQQLSAIKFYISTTVSLAKNKNQQSMLVKSNEALTEVIADMRNICFSLMPKTLEEFGLVKAVRESFNHALYNKKVKFIIEEINPLPGLSAELEIDLYRVIQEFITNAIKHGNANTIHITFSYAKEKLGLKLTDNGTGFNSNKTRKGMGLQNVQSRIKLHYGEVVLLSNIGKGTRYIIMIPLNNQI